MSGPGFIQGVPNFDNLEIVVVGNTTVSSAGSPTNWTTVPHNLGYRPIIFAFLNNVGLSGIFTAGDIPLPTYLGLDITTTIDFTSWLHAGVNNTNAYFVLFNGTGAAIPTFSIKYYLLRERTQ